MGSLQSSTAFLRYGGGVLLLVGIVGYVGILNNVSFFSLDAGENLAHVGLGVIGLAAGFGLKDAMIHRVLTGVVGVTALIFVLIGWFLASGGALTNGVFANPNFYCLANLESRRTTCSTCSWRHGRSGR